MINRAFLPGIKDKKGVREKVFPLCDDCISVLSMGREVLNSRFLDARMFPVIDNKSINIYVVPELIFGKEDLKSISDNTTNFIKNGLRTTEKLFSYLAAQSEALVYHFLFIGVSMNSEKEELHIMIEDVPPSRLKHLEELWHATFRVLLWNKAKNPVFNPKDMGVDLDQAFRTIYSTLIVLSGKDDADKNIMRNRIINIIGRLLGGKDVDVAFIKQLMVRFRVIFQLSVGQQVWIQRT